MSYKERMNSLLEKHMTEKGFKLWLGIKQRIPDCWDKPTSSTKKYHKKMNGEIPTNAEHTYHMLYAATKIYKLFNVVSKTAEADKLLLAIVLHDSLKYGKLGNRPHTDNQHDKNAADMVSKNKDVFRKLLTEEQFFIMEEGIRFHSGQWSTDANKNFSFKNYNPETLFIHILDMMSTADLVQTDMRD